jgi:muramoyltetrapeptide carboxypeptidase
MLASCIGTAHQLQLENDLLLLEDVEEPLYKIDRALTQLQQSGLLAKASGVIFGKTVVPDCPPAEFHQFLAEFFASYKIPVIADFPAGHTPTFISLPLNRTMELKAQLPTLQLQTVE